MLLDILKKGSTDRSVTIRIVDSTDGTPETGVVFNTSGIDLWYRREGAAKVSITEADLTTPALTDAHADGGFLHIGDGYYRLDLPDAAFATGANHVDIGGTVTGMVVIGGRVRLVDYDPEDAVRAGLTALPNAAADAAGGLPISDAGGLDLDTLNSNVSAILVDTGTTLDGKLDTIDSNVDAILVDTAEIGAAGAGLTEAGGTGDHLTAINLPDQSMNITGNITGNLSGSVGSVTGAVGSVTAGVTLADNAITNAKVADSAWQELIELCFTYDATATYATADAGSLVKQIADNAGGSSLTAADIADAVWEEALADHEGTSGSTAESLADAGGSGASAADIADAVLDEALSGHTTAGTLGKAIADILEDTGTTLPGTLTTIAGYIDTEIAAILVDTGTTLDGKLGTIDTVVDAIKAVTDNLPDSGALSSLATASALATVDGNVDAILEDTGTTIPASIDALPTAAEIVTQMGTGTFLTAIPWNASWDAEVQSEVTDALNAYDPPTKAELDTAVDGIPKVGETHRYTNGDEVTVDVTISEAD